MRAVGIDSGYIRLAGHSSRQDGWFEVIVGESLRDDGSGHSFAYVHILEHAPVDRMLAFLAQEGVASGSARDFPVRWHRWHGCPYPALRRLEGLSWELDADCSLEEAKLLPRLEEFIGYIENNQRFIVNYGDRYRHGEPITSSFVESAVNQVVSKRFVKRQQMAWRPAHAHGLLQVRTAS